MELFWTVQVDERRERVAVGLCFDCRWMRRMKSARGSSFYFCERSLTDPAFPKYPRLPVLQCAGYESVRREKEKPK